MRFSRSATFVWFVAVLTATTMAQRGPVPARKVVSAARPMAVRPVVSKKALGKALPVRAKAVRVIGAKPLARKAPIEAKAGSASKPTARKVAPGRPVVGRVLAKGVANRPGAKSAAKATGRPAAKSAATAVLGPAGAERKAIQAKYDAMSLLVMRRDGKRLATLLMGMTTPDFVYRDKRGRKQNRAKLVNDLRAQMKMVAKFKRSGNRIAAFALKAPGGVARVVSDFAMVFPNGKKWVTVVGQSTTDDVWIKTAAGWKLRSIRTLRENVKYNGKPM